MDQFDIDGIRTELRRFLRRFQSCSADKRTRNYFRLYVSGLISNLPRKNCEAIALQAGVPVRSVQWFLAGQRWDDQRMRNKIQRIVTKEHAGKHSIGIIDETSFVKKGEKTPGVQRQYCGQRKGVASRMSCRSLPTTRFRWALMLMSGTT